ncbi:uncharacterized protein KY384_002558 [Bacidia gigantensis]|uniref:uncharacterized protein n=1 Tax=Bacidia gigantensis TaxID=2732470 RepID=UPI001D03D961|nr:uncharacterized protein KY384_002558 [Bacidia gigantensis]KAG8532681.1 hypothetical protein KY384_002558 [Bacidia gigantensis]
MSSYTLLDQTEEDALHKSRLLNVEEKPFKRITKRLLGPNALISRPLTLPPTPPPDSLPAEDESAALERENQSQLEERRQWREDVLLDFAAFESSIVRIQFLITSNIKERERYASEKVKIENTAQSVRDNTTDLRLQLEDAQRKLALRQEYDELAEKIISNPRLKPRDEQQQNIEKLHVEIAELERESQDYAQTWGERREQFGKIIEEGKQLRRLIRDEKEEVERREGMEGQEEGDEDRKREGSSFGTPAPESAGGATPMLGVEKAGDPGDPAGLAVEKGDARGSSPMREPQNLNDEEVKLAEEEKDDEEMGEDGELSAEPEEVVAGPAEGPLGENHERMDTS